MRRQRQCKNECEAGIKREGAKVNARAAAQTDKTAGKARGFATTGLLQRKCACGGSSGLTDQCAKCSKKRLTLQRYSTSPVEPALVPPGVHEVLGSSGEPLDQVTRAFMESRFGHDFSQVRVHTDEKAEESVRAVH